MKNLTDRFGRKHSYLRISVIDRCNLRCNYCMPSEGIEWRESSQILSFEEIRRIAKLLVDSGVKKIRLTGGEPTSRKNIEDLICKLDSICGIETLSMTTNGTTLKNKALTYKKCGIKSINISLDTLQKKRFQEITKRDLFNDVIEGIYTAIEVGFYPLKLNVVIMRGINDDEIIDFVEFVKDKPVNVRFIEYMPFKNNHWEVSKLLPYIEIRSLIEKHHKLIPIKRDLSDVAKDFCIRGFLGTVSFITSMTEIFCSTCNRLRLTADGHIKSCLFQNNEINLRTPLRNGATDKELLELINYSLLLKEKEHLPMEELAKSENRAMVQIGG